MSVCQAVHERKELTHLIQRCVGDDDTHFPPVHELTGSEAELLEAFHHLMGVVAEYTDGGDQMAEGCTCLNGSASQHRHVEGNEGVTFMDMLEDPDHKGCDEP